LSHSSISFQNGWSFEASAVGFGFSAEASAMYAAARNINQSQAVQALKSRNDSNVITAMAACLTHDVSIGFFKRVKFTRDFFFALLFLNHTLERSENEQLKAYSRFTTAFGTHFIRKANTGASMSYQKVFTARSENDSAQKIRADCFTLSAERCIGSRDFVAKTCISTKSRRCAGSSSTLSSNYRDKSIDIVTRGSTPKGNLHQWIDSDFKPYPALVKLEPIVDLITSYNLEASETYGIPETLDQEGLQRLMSNGNLNYCSKILNLNPQECKGQLNDGCGVSGNCELGQCVDDDPSKTISFTGLTKVLVTSGIDEGTMNIEIIDLNDPSNACHSQQSILDNYHYDQVESPSGGLLTNNIVLICGGIKKNKILDDCFAVTDNKVEAIEVHLSLPRYAAASVVWHGNTLWLTGGSLDGTGSTKSTEFVQLTGSRPGPDLPLEVCLFCLSHVPGDRR
jgi:hypothetical protein